MIISCNSSKVGCLFLGLVVVFHLITTLLPSNHSLTHSLTHQQQVLVLGLGFFFLFVGYFFSVWFCLSLQQQAGKTNNQASKQASKTNNQASKQASKQNKQSSKQACKTNNQASKQANKQVIKQSNSTAASNLSSTEPITRFFFYPFSSLQCSVPDFCEDLSKPHFS